jgi:hypothetical protein
MPLLMKFLISFGLSSLIFVTPLALSNPSQSTLLIIGDSQSYGLLGRELLKQLHNENISTSYYSRPGSGASWWMSGEKAPESWGSWDAPHNEKEIRVPEALATPLIRDLLLKHQPHLVVIQLGGNMAWQKAHINKTNIQTLIRQIHASNSECFWIGPPPGERRPQPQFDNFYKILEEIALQESCFYMDSRQVIRPAPKGGDGIHLDSMGKKGREAIQKWSQAISQEILFLLRNTQRVPAHKQKTKFLLDSYLGPSIKVPQ